MPRHPRTSSRPAVPDHICARLFTGHDRSPHAAELVERMLAASSGAVVLTDAESRAVDRFVAIVAAQAAVRTHARSRGRDVLADRVLDIETDSVTMAVLSRSRHRRGTGRHCVQIARSVDGQLTMTTLGRGLDPVLAHATWTNVAPPRA